MKDISNTMTHAGKKVFLCAKIYEGEGDKYPINGCNTGTDFFVGLVSGTRPSEAYSIPDGYKGDAGKDQYYSMGSILGMAIEKYQ